MNRDWLFLRLLEELAQIDGGIGDDFQLLRASATLRQLLVDDDPLMHQVNRERRLKVLFTACVEDAYVALLLEDQPTFWAWMDGFSPRYAPAGTRTESLSLKNLLAKRAALVAGENVSVKDLIAQIANVEGGVHAGTPRTDLQRRLSETNVSIRLEGSGAVARTLRGITDVVVQGLQPLADQIRHGLRA